MDFFSSLPFLSGNTNIATVAIWQLVYRTNLDQKAVIAPERSSLFCLQLKEIEDKILEVLSSSEVRVFFFFCIFSPFKMNVIIDCFGFR